MHAIGWVKQVEFLTKMQAAGMGSEAAGMGLEAAGTGLEAAGGYNANCACCAMSTG